MRPTAAALAATLAVLITACSSTAEPETPGATPSTAAVAASPASSDPQPTTPTPAVGAWVDHAAYEADRDAFHAQGDVVLFFNASWCPTCRQTVGSLDKDGVPPGLTVVGVDYDSADALRRQYGVTVQHTFVQVDVAGQRLAKFTGSLTGAEIAEQTA